MATRGVEETKWVKCYCCGLIEECTVEYIDGVKERYQDRWICGLCDEAVKEESAREITSFCQAANYILAPNAFNHSIVLKSVRNPLLGAMSFQKEHVPYRPTLPTSKKVLDLSDKDTQAVKYYL